jgi:predicted flap endonuclease-1-like 5' DNA nuclease
VEPDSIPLNMDDVRSETVTYAALAPDEAEAAADMASEGAPVAPTESLDDLKVIEGIGPSIAGLLRENGIASFKVLAEAPVERLTEILTAARLNHLADPTTWGEQARLAAAGEWDRLEEYQATLKGGRKK